MMFSGGIDRDQWHIMIKWVNQVFFNNFKQLFSWWISLRGFSLAGQKASIHAITLILF